MNHKMEDILEAWEKAKPRPQFKAEYIVSHAITGSLAEGARVTAARLKMNKDETEALVQRFGGCVHELSGPHLKPVPPFLFEISKDSRDHSREVQQRSRKHPSGAHLAARPDADNRERLAFACFLVPHA